MEKQKNGELSRICLLYTSAMQEEQGHFTEHGYISLSGDEWNHERPAEPEKKPSIREQLEQGKKECAEKNKAQPHKEKSAPEL